tara:strand:- start:105 stop:365 length:261 start_codon:yes stop_codon:yes gene_type:complete
MKLILEGVFRITLNGKTHLGRLTKKTGSVWFLTKVDKEGSEHVTVSKNDAGEEVHTSHLLVGDEKELRPRQMYQDLKYGTLTSKEK